MHVTHVKTPSTHNQTSGRENICPRYKSEFKTKEPGYAQALITSISARCIIVMRGKTMDMGILGILAGWSLVAWYWKLDSNPVGGQGLPWSLRRH